MIFMEADCKDPGIEVEVAYATAAKQTVLSLEVPAGCTVAQVIELSGIGKEFPDLEPGAIAVGIFSRKVPLDREVQNGDRVEIYRPLLADPKEMRKQRAQNKHQ
jgi:putative ubiquitin-RnfH superfamily antitoxin RatB of RatAB toxin-antitoxin module